MGELPFSPVPNGKVRRLPIYPVPNGKFYCFFICTILLIFYRFFASINLPHHALFTKHLTQSIPVHGSTAEAALPLCYS